VANSLQARKRARQNTRSRELNVGMRSMMRTQLKKVLSALDAGDKVAAQAAYKVAMPVIDRMADKELLHKNKAARYKSRLNARIRAMA
jgi:small subunit ribosomal protein S20